MTVDREARRDITVNESVYSVVAKVKEARDLNRLLAIHERHGDHAMWAAHRMLERELEGYTMMVEPIQELPAREKFRAKYVDGARRFLDKAAVTIRDIGVLVEAVERVSEAIGGVQLEQGVKF